MTDNPADLADLLPDPPDDLSDAVRRLEAITHLLDLASTTAWQQREDENAGPALGLFAFAVHRASCRVGRLVPADHHWSDDLIDGMWVSSQAAAAWGVDGMATDRQPVLRLLLGARAQSRPLAVHGASLPGATQLAVELGGLIDEARHLGC